MCKVCNVEPLRCSMLMRLTSAYSLPSVKFWVSDRHTSSSVVKHTSLNMPRALGHRLMPKMLSLAILLTGGGGGKSVLYRMAFWRVS
jgi:hypothetical protein